ncbi:MAG: filamentous hemagglutinin N-terminal domain-containing protein, partial [Pseudomonadota bacterium]
MPASTPSHPIHCRYGPMSRTSSNLRYGSSTLLALAVALIGRPGLAELPDGGTVVRGDATITRKGDQVIIEQGSQRVAIDWNTFNVGVGKRVDFMQPGSDATALNRIFDQNPSEILGQVNANGRIILANPNGVYFGESARVNVGSLIASGHHVDADRFMEGDVEFEALNGSAGPVTNRGVITAASGGSVGLIGGRVENSGSIVAHAGRVELAAGDRIALDFDGDGLMRFAIKEEVLENLAAIESAVLNSGEIDARGGLVRMRGRVARDLFDHVVNNEGVVRAGRIENEGGTIRLTGSGGAEDSVVNTGRLDASAADADSDGGRIELESDGTTLVAGDGALDVSSEGGEGGTIHVLGENVGLFDSADLDASGATGGGTILVGGDYQGGNSEVRNAERTLVDADVTLSADALDVGDGGRIITWADDWTRFAGTLSARGGENGGDGGFAEVSGKKSLVYRGSSDLRAPHGMTGTLLLDPRDISIVDGNDGTASDDGELSDEKISFSDWNDADADQFSDDYTISNGSIEAQSGNIILQANRDITQEAGAAIDLTVNADQSITLQAGNDITLNSTITTNSGSIHLEADSPHASDGTNDGCADCAPANGTGTLSIQDTLSSSDGDITLIGADFDISAGIDAGAGTIAIAPSEGDTTSQGD